MTDEERMVTWERVEFEAREKSPEELTAEGKPIQMKELPSKFWGYLTPKAARVLRVKQVCTIIELAEGEDGECYPMRYKCRLPSLGHEYYKDGKWVKEEDLPKQEYKRILKLCAYFNKRVYLEDNGEIPDWALRKTAATMNLLVKDGLIDYGMLAPPMSLPLASGEVVGLDGKPKDMGPPSVLILLYVFPTYDSSIMAEDQVKMLNKHLGNEAFMAEGECGNTNWDGLPTVSPPED